MIGDLGTYEDPAGLSWASSFSAESTVGFASVEAAHEAAQLHLGSLRRGGLRDRAVWTIEDAIDGGHFVRFCVGGVTIEIWPEGDADG
ncbi:hypothetical protein P1X14_18915 [Sphingomonas sp. AOB5]|uniref:hypothetical protein n=1 Tax=Sphingomonas sp. AOB5 TaxID=3034017 RepID=UPI0023F8A410|nr:hypothetical protein [Sphingomonas sp. AOB5]MDF7777337.1 hypothetical protein [Sphingomonas sp. AOB5]